MSAIVVFLGNMALYQFTPISILGKINASKCNKMIWLSLLQPFHSTRLLLRSGYEWLDFYQVKQRTQQLVPGWVTDIFDLVEDPARVTSGIFVLHMKLSGVGWEWDWRSHHPHLQIAIEGISVPGSAAHTPFSDFAGWAVVGGFRAVKRCGWM